MADDVTTLTTISSGLKWIDQFRELAIRLRGDTPYPAGTVVEQVGEGMRVVHDGNVVQVMTPAEMHLNEWDAVAYAALNTRVGGQWARFNELFAQEPLVDPPEQERLREQMEQLRVSLCDDFRAMVRLYEQALNTSLPDHYMLYEVCR